MAEQSEMIRHKQTKTFFHHNLSVFWFMSDASKKIVKMCSW